MKKLTLVATSLVAGLTLSACSSLPESIPEVEEARLAVSAADRHRMAENVAGAELEQAKAALARADSEIDDNGDLEDVLHHAYVAQRHAEIVLERIGEEEALDRIDDAEAERAKALLEARELEAENAQALASAKSREAELERQRARKATEEAEKLRTLVEELDAERTERGLVLTMGDVLFDTDKAELKPGALSTIDRLAEFMADYPDYRLIIEGHADSTGEPDYNLGLSERRAESVRIALLTRGIDPARLRAVGMGQSYPVASNDTAVGRQQNRRVEIIVSRADGSFPETVERSAAVRNW